MNYFLSASLSVLIMTVTTADAVLVDYGGIEYDVTSFNTRYIDNEALLSSQPWFGDTSKSIYFANAVNSSLGGSLPGAEPRFKWGLPGPDSYYPAPIFASGKEYDQETGINIVNSFFYRPDNDTVEITTEPDFTFATYAQAVTRGGSQAFPVLPSGPSGEGLGWQFTGDSGLWFDPIAANGFEFTMTDGSLFTEILNFPTGVDGDNSFNVSSGGASLGSFNVGESVDFGAGVSSFKITGIDPAVDGEDPTVFPIQLAFNNPTGSFTMVPILVPEPSVSLLLFSGLTSLLLRRKRLN